MTMPFRFAFILVLALILSGCGLLATPAPFVPTRVPPTPISTHLPSVATDIPAGYDTNNPIRLVFVADDNGAADALAEQINAISEIEVEVVLVDNQNEAMTMLCSSNTGTVSAAWINGSAYAAAKQCGIVSLQVERGTGRVSNTGESAVLVIAAAFAAEDGGGLSAALEENFCRVSVNDFYGWLVPQMLFAIEEIDPTSIADINEYPDNDALVAALASGECAAIGMAESQWENYKDADDTLPDALLTSAPFPYSLMVFPFEADLQVINELTSILLQLDIASGRSSLDAAEPEGTAESTPDPEATAAPEIEISESDMAALFGDGYLIPVESRAFETLDTFLESTGLNFAQIGK